MSPYIDETDELVDTNPIIYYFNLSSLFHVEPNIVHHLSVRLDGSYHDPNNSNDLDINFVSKEKTIPIMVYSVESTIESTESEISCPIIPFLENKLLFSPRSRLFYFTFN